MRERKTRKTRREHTSARAGWSAAPHSRARSCNVAVSCSLPLNAHAFLGSSFFFCFFFFVFFFFFSSLGCGVAACCVDMYAHTHRRVVCRFVQSCPAAASPRGSRRRSRRPPRSSASSRSSPPSARRAPEPRCARLDKWRSDRPTGVAVAHARAVVVVVVGSLWASLLCRCAAEANPAWLGCFPGD